MDVIVVSHRRGKSWQLPAAAVWMLGLGVLSLTVTGGYALGRAGQAQPTLLSKTVAEKLAAEVAVQRAELTEARVTAEESSRQTARRMAELSAQLIRLDAAGERMVTLANLDPKEFSFGEPVAVGGPETEEVAEALPADPLLARINAFETQLGDRERQLRVLEDLLLASKMQDDVQPSGWPVVGGFISSLFGYRADPFTGRGAFHQGIDFAGPYGSSVYSVASGVVSFAGDRSGYGSVVEINHGNGYVTRYGHNSSIKVRVGDTVRKNQVIALMGSSGRSTGPHVHFEVLINGSQVNPAQFVHAGK